MKKIILLGHSNHLSLKAKSLLNSDLRKYMDRLVNQKQFIIDNRVEFGIDAEYHIIRKNKTCNCTLCSLKRVEQDLSYQVDTKQAIIDYARAIIQMNYDNESPIKFSDWTTIEYNKEIILEANNLLTISNEKIRKTIGEKLKEMNELKKEYVSVRDGIVRLMQLTNLPV